jgi:hypothetical protein
MKISAKPESKSVGELIHFRQKLITQKWSVKRKVHADVIEQMITF